METAQRGLWSGILATGPMTLFMFRMQRALPREQRSPLPPATLTYQVTGVPKPFLTMLAHFTYGAGTGLIYSLLASRWRRPSIGKGAAFGVTLWALSYAGWIPILGFRSRATNMTKERNALMILAHVAWGACLGYAESELKRHGEQMLRAKP